MKKRSPYRRRQRAKMRCRLRQLGVIPDPMAKIYDAKESAYWMDKELRLREASQQLSNGIDSVRDSLIYLTTSAGAAARAAERFKKMFNQPLPLFTGTRIPRPIFKATNTYNSGRSTRSRYRGKKRSGFRHIKVTTINDVLPKGKDDEQTNTK